MIANGTNFIVQTSNDSLVGLVLRLPGELDAAIDDRDDVRVVLIQRPADYRVSVAGC